MTIGDLLVRVGAEISGFKTAMSEVSSSSNTAASAAAASAGKISSAMDGTSSAAGRAASAFSAATSKIASSFESIAGAASKLTSIGTTMTAAITVPIAGIGIAALKTAGDLEQNKIAFTQMMGSAEAAQKHLDQLRDFALKTPFEFTDLTSASKKMQAFGFSAKDVIPILRTVGDAASAFGAGAEGIDRITRALGQMQAKGTVQAQEMNQLAEMGIGAWKMLAKTLNVDVATAMKMVEQRTVSAGIAIPAILNGMNEKFSGMMEQQSKTLLGQWSNIKESITVTLTEVGKALMPVAKNMMENVITPALNAVKGLALAFGQLPQPVQTAALGFIAFMAVVGPAAAIIGKTITTLGQLATLVNTVAMALTELLVPSVAKTTVAVAASSDAFKLAMGSMTGMGSAATATNTALLGMSPIIAGISLALAGLVTAVGLAILSINRLKEARDRLFTDQSGSAGAEVGFWSGVQAAIANNPLTSGIGKGAQAASGPATEIPIGTAESLSAHRAAKKTEADKLLENIGSKNTTFTPDMFGGVSGPNAEQQAKAAKKAAQEIKQAFSDLGLRDLEGQLEKAEAAFDKLKRQGQISEGWEIKAATDKITDLKAKIAELAAGYTELPKGNIALLNSIDELAKKIQSDPGSVAARNHLAEMSKAIEQLEQQSRNFSGPKIGPQAEASVLALKDATKLYADSLTAVYNEEQKLNLSTAVHMQALQDLPALHHAVAASILDPLAGINGLMQAYRFFNIETTDGLREHAKEAEKQYEIIRSAASSSAIAITKAFAEKTLAVIELERREGDITEELYQQRKAMAEGVLKSIEGTSKTTHEKMAKHVWSASEEMKRAMKGTFDDFYKGIVDNGLHWQAWAKDLKGLWKETVYNLKATMLEQLFKPLETAMTALTGKIADEFAGLLKKIPGIGSIFGSAAPAAGTAASTAASTAGTAGSSAAGAAGSAAGAGISGVVSAVSGVVSAVSGVIGNFQFMGMNKSLDVLVNHTLRIFNITEQMLGEMYEGKGQLFNKMDDMWRTLLDIKDILGQAFSIDPGRATAQAMAEAFSDLERDNTGRRSTRDYDPRPQPVNITIEGTPVIDATVDKVAKHLMRNGIYV